MSVTDIVRRFGGVRVLVVGDVMLDSYFEGTASRLCTEGPVPVVRRTAESRKPGGAGNTAANLAALGAEVTLVGLLGDDEPGSALRATLRACGVDDRWLVPDEHAATLHKLRILADGQYVVRFDQGDTASVSEDTVARLVATIFQAAAGCDAILVSDYVAGTICPGVLEALSALWAAREVPLVVDSKDLRRFAGIGATVVTPNRLEASLLVNRSDGGPEVDAASLAGDVQRMLDARYAAVTLGADGVQLAGRDGRSEHFPEHPVHRAHDVGAGDTFAAALTLSLAAGAPVEEAVRLGIDAAAIAVSRPQTATVSQQELLQRASLREYTAVVGDGFESTLQRIEQHRAAGRRIVFTNGVFDILHAGHVEFLRQAKELGDVLVVAVNSDRSTRKLKGRNRPINSERDRLALISALGPVDHAIIFDDETPTGLIRLVRPDVHVKGGDHAGQVLPEAAAVEESGGEVVILPLVGNVSTSAVIDRILSLSAVPAGMQVPLD